jgi:excinuclease ABC subunit A
MRTTIEVRGARENNLQDVSLEIPRDKLVVVTGVSGSGKSSLAFDTVYAEGQRRLMASMSSFAKRFVNQLKKPDVDFVNGLSPVISIDQKTTGNNPRSTVGTMTDIWDYLRMLFATIGQPHCPLSTIAGKPQKVGSLSPQQMLEYMLSLPKGTEVEIRAPVFRIYGEDYEYLFEQIRTHGYRRVRIDGVEHDVGGTIDVDEESEHQVEAIVDCFVVEPGIERQVIASLESGLKLGDGYLSFHIVGGKVSKARQNKFHKSLGSSRHNVIAGRMHHGDFTFNDPAGACVTCAGLGTTKRVHPPLLVPDRSRTLRDGAIVKAAMTSDRNTWGGRMLHSLSKAYRFSLDVPFDKLSRKAVDVLFYGTKGKKFRIAIPEGARQGLQHKGKETRFGGVVNNIEHHYRWYRKQGSAKDGMEEYLNKVMIDLECPECNGARLKLARRIVTINSTNLHEVGEMHLLELLEFLDGLDVAAHHSSVVDIIVREIRTRLELLIEIGLDYLNLNRRSGTLSGGEAQRIRLSSQIGSGLMGMLYVLDEPSIGLHAKDNVRMIATMKRLRDLGNTVVVVEHDDETIRAADHVIEIGPGPGVHGGCMVYEGSVDGMMKDKASLTGQFLSGRASIAIPESRRTANGNAIEIIGARENNLQDVSVRIPLGLFVCITGTSGSGKSSLIHEILYKKLYSLLQDSRVLSGDHDQLLGHEHVDDIIHIDQSAIGRSPRSNPATYIGFYDNIRKLFAATEEATARGYSSSRFSFNVKGGRCEECAGDGNIVTKLSFMPDVAVTCPACKGARYNQETLEVLLKDRTISDVLDMSIEEGVDYFAGETAILRRLQMLNDLGLGYLKIGHPATILSGGEAQRIKLSGELSKLKRGKHNLYILDEPTTGLHFADIQRLLDSLNRLVEQGHSVVVIEHNMDVIKTADHIIDLGPEGGHNGGKIIAEGTPEKVAACRKSHTGRHLKPYLG